MKKLFSYGLLLFTLSGTNGKVSAQGFLDTRKIIGDTVVCNNSVMSYDYSRNTYSMCHEYKYNWYVTNGRIMYSKGNHVKVRWDELGRGSLTLTVTPRRIYNIYPDGYNPCRDAKEEMSYTYRQSVLIIPPNVGTLSESVVNKKGTSHRGTITLSDHMGSVIRWEKSTDGEKWIPISRTANTTTISYHLTTSTQTTTKYRAYIETNNCGKHYTHHATITLTAPKNGEGNGKADCVDEWGMPIKVSETVCENTIVSYSMKEKPFSPCYRYDYQWVVANGQIVGSKNNGYVRVKWNKVGRGSIKCTETPVYNFIKKSKDDLEPDCDIELPTTFAKCVKIEKGRGVLSPTSGSYCSSSTTVRIKLSDYKGTISHWEKSYNGGAWQTIAETSSTLSYELKTTTQVVAKYRAYVNTDHCEGLYTDPATITLRAPSSAEVMPVLNTAYGTKSGHLNLNTNGWVQTWQYKTASGNWTDIKYDKYSINKLFYKNITTNTQYRVVVKSYNCPAVNSNIAEVVIYDLPKITLDERPVSDVELLTLGKNMELVCDNSHYKYQWKKNGANIPNATERSYTVSSPGSYSLWVKKHENEDAEYTTKPIVVKDINEIQNQNYILTIEPQKSGVSASTNLYTLGESDLKVGIRYYDGLGRHMQSIGIGGSPLGNDIVQPIAYDNLGRQPIAYLPYTSSERDGRYVPNALAIQGQFYQADGDKIPKDNRPFNETIYESSPLNRVHKQYGPGEDWKLKDKAVSYRYEINQANEVKLWKIIGGLPVSTEHYESGQLYKNVTIDEQGHQVVAFVDKHGRTVLKRVQANENASQWADTYYLYDDLGSLRYILPPEACKSITNTPTLGFLNRWAFQYKFDRRKRMIEKKVPGAGAVYMIYDKRDRLVLTQDAQLRQRNQWIFTKYDHLNRPVSTGTYTNTTQITRAALQAHVDSQMGVPGNSTWYESRQITAGNVHGYDNASFPKVTQEADYLTITYYDDYGFKNNWGTSYHYSKPADDPCITTNAIYCYENEAFASIKGLVTGGKVKNLSDNSWLKSVTYYDDRYRAIQTVAQNHKGGIDRTSNLYDFVGKVLETRTVHNNGTNAKNTKRNYTYDHAGRLLSLKHQLDNEPQVTIATQEYNELGKLVKKNLHVTEESLLEKEEHKWKLLTELDVNLFGFDGFGYNPFDTVPDEKFVLINMEQSIDYRHNIRGWLTSINDAALSDGENDLFGMELGYNTDIGLSLPTAYHQYNGNISAVKWSGEQEQLGYGYTYDAMNRLKTADHRIVGTANATAFDVNGLTYDLNGNIKTLTRYDRKGVMDRLTYRYGTGQARSNQLLSVGDTGTDRGFKDGNTQGNDYTYDPNGNMTIDKNKGLKSIVYNHLNLPTQATKSDNQYIKYHYDATGTKLAQEVYNASNVLQKRTDYIGAFIYEQSGNNPSVLSIIQHEEGRIVPNRVDNTYDYQYHLRDHLGNTRLTFTTKPKTHNFTLNYESNQRKPDDKKLFKKVDNIIHANIHDHTDAGSTYTKSQKLTGANRSIIGSVLTIPVGKGDKVSAEVYAKYLAPTNTTNPLASVGAAVIGAITGSTGASNYEGAIRSSFGSRGSMISSLFSDQIDDSRPRAFINLMFLPSQAGTSIDNNHFAFTQVSSASDNTHAALRLSEYEAPASGFIVLYLSNESHKLTEVYFDDLKVTVTESKVVQRDDYYPFGLSFNSWKRSTARENKYLYQGKEQQDDLDLGTFDFHARMYDPYINRTWQLDPMSDAFDHLSPYSWVANNPLKFVDPTGMYMVDVETEYEKRERKRKEEEEKRKKEEEKERRKAERERKRNKKDKPSSCPECPADKKYDKYRNSHMSFGYDKDVGVYNDFEGGGQIGGSKGNIESKGVSNNFRNIAQGAGYLSGAVGASQLGLLEYRRGLSIHQAVNSSSRLFSTYRGLGVASRYLGYTGYLGVPLSIYSDVNDLKSGQISPMRFGYRATGLGLSIGVGASIGGPGGALGGAVVGGIWSGIEYTYDLWKNDVIPKIRNVMPTGGWAIPK